jgi:hypothetical protein
MGAETNVSPFGRRLYLMSVCYVAVLWCSIKLCLDSMELVVGFCMFGLRLEAGGEGWVVCVFITARAGKGPDVNSRGDSGTESPLWIFTTKFMSKSQHR